MVFEDLHCFSIALHFAASASPSTDMPSIREATSADFASIINIFATSFRHESYISFLHPAPPASEELFTRDLERYWRKQIREKWYDTSQRILVSADEKGSILGAAIWKQPVFRNEDAGWCGVSCAFTLLCYISCGYHRGFRRRLASWLTSLLLTWAQLVNILDALLFPDTSFDRSRRRAYADAEPFFSPHFTMLGPHYSLELLGVLPSAQRSGHGRTLVEWGLIHARKRHVCAAVVCGQGSDSFYRKCGYQREVGNVTDGADNPLGEVEGGAILVWGPSTASSPSRAI